MNKIKYWGRRYAQAYADCYRYLPPVRWLVDTLSLRNLYLETVTLRRDIHEL